MIESCSKKRMIFAIAVMAGLSFLVIILESSQLRSNSEDFQDIHETHPVLKEKLKEKDKCWLKETYTVTEECDVCSPEEVSSHKPVVCAVAKSEFRWNLACRTPIRDIAYRLQGEGEVSVGERGLQSLW